MSLSLDELYGLSLRQFENFKKGFQRKMIRQKYMQAELGYVVALMNNGKSISPYLRSVELQESQIGKTEEEIKTDKAVKKAVQNKQQADLISYLNNMSSFFGEPEGNGESNLPEGDTKQSETPTDFNPLSPL